MKTHRGEVIGSMCVLDTRPRQATDQQKETLISLANAVMMAIDLHGTAAPDEEEATEPEG